MSAHLERARWLVRQNRHLLAEQEIALALALNPNDADAYRLQAHCLLARDEYAKATAAAQQAVALDPTEAMSYYTLGRVWLARGHLDEAASAAREAIRIEPEDADYYTLLAVVLNNQKRWTEALPLTETALTLDSSNTWALNTRAKTLRALGRKEDARLELRASLLHDAENPATHANLGWNCLHQNDRAGAELHFREALRLNPDSESARSGYLEVLKSGNRFYRWMLNYFLWMESKTAGRQMMFLVGAYVAFLVTMSVATSNPTWGWVLWPPLIAYIIFAVGTWLAVPLANLGLMLHPIGRRILNRSEKLEAMCVGLMLILVLSVQVAAYLHENLILSVARIYAFNLGVAVAMTAISRRPQARRILLFYTAGVAVLTVVILGMLISSEYSTWMDNHETVTELVIAGMKVLSWTGLGAVILSNVLASRSWKK
ncbi:MAG: tetratricopeptide repeat protein [Planctomycetia bacterium]|nr:tetratricopeptide repeat protein [Planctomycetia bacterium]